MHIFEGTLWTLKPVQYVSRMFIVFLQNYFICSRENYSINCGFLHALRAYYKKQCESLGVTERKFKYVAKKSKSVKTHYFMSSTDKNATENSFKNIPVIVEAGGTVHKTWKPLEALSSKNYNVTNQHVLPSDEPLRIFPSLRSPIPFLSHLPTICAYNSKWLQHQCFFSMKKC